MSVHSPGPRSLLLPAALLTVCGMPFHQPGPRTLVNTPGLRTLIIPAALLTVWCMPLNIPGMRTLVRPAALLTQAKDHGEQGKDMFIAVAGLSKNKARDKDAENRKDQKAKRTAPTVGLDGTELTGVGSLVCWP